MFQIHTEMCVREAAQAALRLAPKPLRQNKTHLCSGHEGSQRESLFVLSQLQSLLGLLRKAHRP